METLCNVKIMCDLVSRYDVIVVEDLKVTQMVSNHRLSKSKLYAGWSHVITRLQVKAEEDGRAIDKVNPAYTSKACSQCGMIFSDLKLSDRWIRCIYGLSLDRDHNAAIVEVGSDRALKC